MKKSFKDYYTNTKKKKNKLLKPVKRPKLARLGGYPYGTRPGDGGLSAGFAGTGGGEGGMGESYVAEDRFSFAPENEEVRIDQPDEIQSPEEVNVDDSPMDNEDNSDPDRQGLIRRVPGAHLVYKRQSETGTFEELWIYECPAEMKDEISIKTAILAGTDVDSSTGKSEDGEQTYELWNAGNAQMMLIQGLPN